VSFTLYPFSSFTLELSLISAFYKLFASWPFQNDFLDQPKRRPIKTARSCLSSEKADRTALIPSLELEINTINSTLKACPASQCILSPPTQPSCTPNTKWEEVIRSHCKLLFFFSGCWIMGDAPKTFKTTLVWILLELQMFLKVVAPSERAMLISKLTIDF